MSLQIPVMSLQIGPHPCLPINTSAGGVVFPKHIRAINGLQVPEMRINCDALFPYNLHYDTSDRAAAANSYFRMNRHIATIPRCES
jgi:hypothetical protein